MIRQERTWFLVNLKILAQKEQVLMLDRENILTLKLLQLLMKLEKIEVATEYKQLQIREITDSGGYHRRVLTPDATLAEDEHQEIKDKAEALWTDEVKTAWSDFDRERCIKEFGKWID